ncbi:MAG: Ig-like domain-containing protein [Candidatus Riflebacteria bacterium]
MNRWKRAAILCALLAAMGTPVFAGLDRNTVTAESAAIRISNHFPANLAADVSPETPLTVEFAGSVNQSFYQTVNLNLFNGTDPVEGELFYNPSARQIMFKSKQPLKEGHTYTAQLSYFDGLGRTSEKVWSFQTTGQETSFQPLPAQQPAPAPAATQAPAPENFLNIANASMGSGKISNTTALEVTFTEPLDIVSLKSAPVKLFENNQPIGIDYKLSRDLKTLTISPRNGLKANAAYAVAVDQNLAATTGERLRKKTLIPFRLGVANEQHDVAQHEIEESPAPANASFDNPFEETPAPRQKVAARPETTSRPAPRPETRRQSAPVQLVGLSPINGARVTNLTQPVTIGFSEEIRAETLNEFTFRLEDDFGPVPAKIHYFKGHKQATLTPVGLLDSNKNYRVVVTQGITDLNGQPIRSGINSMFSTSSPAASPAMPEMMAMTETADPEQETAEIESFDQPAPRPARTAAQAPATARRPERKNVNSGVSAMAATAPADRNVRTVVQDKPSGLNPFKVTAIFPAADNQNVSRKSKIAVHFSEPADPNTVNNINISVFGKQTRVEGKVIFDRRKNRAIFEPASPLDANTQYKVLVSDKIRSKMGEQLASNFSWEFATSEGLKHNYNPRQTAEADAAFYIPLVDSKLKKEPGQGAARLKSGANSNAAFNFVESKHWAFRSVRHITNKGILNTFPFVYTDSVTRYEFATAINSALSNLKSMQHMSSKPKLKIADMVELQQLIVEFRTELKSCAVNTQWFESFLSKQGVNLQQVEMKVRKLNKG